MAIASSLYRRQTHHLRVIIIIFFIKKVVFPEIMTGPKALGELLAGLPELP